MTISHVWNEWTMDDELNQVPEKPHIQSQIFEEGELNTISLQRGRHLLPDANCWRQKLHCIAFQGKWSSFAFCHIERVKVAVGVGRHATKPLPWIQDVAMLAAKLCSYENTATHTTPPQPDTCPSFNMWEVISISP